MKPRTEKFEESLRLYNLSESKWFSERKMNPLIKSANYGYSTRYQSIAEFNSGL